MKNKKTLLMMSGLLALSITPLILFPIIKYHTISSIKGNNYPYYLNINKSKNRYTGSTPYTVSTERGTEIDFACDGLTSNADYAFTMSDAGYVYNEDILSGLMSINVTFTGGLTVYYGYSISPNDDNYSIELTSNTSFDFDGTYPGYFQLKATADTSVDSISLAYDCMSSNEGIYFDEYETEVYAQLTGSDLLTSAVIPDTYKGKPVTKMISFSNQSDLVEVYIGKNVVEMIDEFNDACYFTNCPMLESIVVDEDNQTFKSVDGVLYSKNGQILYRYPSNKAGTLFATPDSVQEIGMYAFECCNNLLSIDINRTTTICEGAFMGSANISSFTSYSTYLTTIGPLAFSECTGLVSIELPGGVSSVDGSAFDYASSLESIVVNNNYYYSIDGILYEKSSHALMRCPEGHTFTNDEYSIPSGCEEILDYAFYNVNQLRSLTIPGTVTSISTFAFDFCPQLEAFNVANDNSDYSSLDGVLFNKTQTTLIRFPESLVPLDIYEEKCIYAVPDTVDTINDYAFADCNLLQAIYLSANINSIGENAFDGDSEDGNNYLFIFYQGSSGDWSNISFYEEDSQPVLGMRYDSNFLTTDTVYPPIDPE